MTESATTTVDGRKIRAYRFAATACTTRIGFVLDGKREYQLLCEVAAARRPGRRVRLLFSSFSVA